MLPDVSNASEVILDAIQRPRPDAPSEPQALFHEPGVRPSRALPYELHVTARSFEGGNLQLTFANTGQMGAVFHVYDKLHLERIPRRYTVEAGKEIEDKWSAEAGSYDLWVYGPNGFLREFKGTIAQTNQQVQTEIELKYDVPRRSIILTLHNKGAARAEVVVRANAYYSAGPWTLSVTPGEKVQRSWPLIESGNWYDFTASGEGLERRFAGRLEGEAHGISDPAM